MFRHRLLPFPCLSNVLFLLPFSQSQGKMYDKHLGLLLPMAAMTPDLQSPRLNRRRQVRHRVHTPAYASFTGMSKGLVLDMNEIVDISEDGASVQCSSGLELNRNYVRSLDFGQAPTQILTTGRGRWSEASG